MDVDHKNVVLKVDDRTGKPFQEAEISKFFLQQGVSQKELCYFVNDGYQDLYNGRVQNVKPLPVEMMLDGKAKGDGR